MISRWHAGCLSLALAIGQDGPKPKGGQPAPPGDARRLLARLAERQRPERHLTADYVQTRTSALVVEPLVSRGELLFRRSPGCVVFRVREPRDVVVRLDEKTYQVHRPAARRLERYWLPSSELPRALFQALSPRVAELEKSFRVARTEIEGEAKDLRRITLEPRGAGERKLLRGFSMLLRVEDARLLAVRYRDRDGDRVEIELSNIRVDPEVDAKVFDAAVPEGTRVIEHRPRKQPRDE